ncbi:Gfo/Idh/MocA family protein [Paractinoplanes hotanensis]|uniref:Gfo/Idh/MocA family oxidoreductase n=1 Tax=Paractinoplanes hotanensis TaxID=2906497 RepID=A0ABT0Y7S7_9ACTN|nr:Gfo/Idh/MocA family oxidoreductase [Actinoplanes hotanensis]MCM4082103.1 Gfo/Idh/MocA family oxidoreductase [Actinoplanes hotanensis]
MTPRVALIGANGHGRWHRRRIAELRAGGIVSLVGLADVQPIDPAPDVPAFTDHRELLAATQPDVVVICTPPHTHLPIALDALRAGCDLLLEKPPVTSPADHETLLTALRSTGRSCQVGFQALGSVAWSRFRDALSPRTTGLTAVASWKRDDTYYARSPWAGRRVVGGRPVVDGALVNPLAHAVMQALAAGAAAGAGRPRQLEAERYRVRPIEVEDTAFARITFESGLPLLVAVTLAGEDFIAGEIEARGPDGTAVLEYPTDRLALPGSGLTDSARLGSDLPGSKTPGAGLIEVPGRTDLLTDLVRHRAEGTPLLVPLEATAAFTTVLEALTMPEAPEPRLLNSSTVAIEGPNRTIPGINALLRRAAAELKLPSELDVPWSAEPFRRRLPVTWP